ncbi:hypothetical protein FRC08_000090 [Ceratobasidium sp. 394]|nr:hypothetical protein FRC08_000090 [Ceratobasidium sp. 394]
MSSWISISGLVKNVANLWLDATTSPGDVDVMLEEVRATLKSTKALVESHKTLLASEDYATLVAKHRSFELDMMQEMQPKPRRNKISRRARVAALRKMIDKYKREAVLFTQRATKHTTTASPFEDPSPASPLETQLTQISSSRLTGFQSFIARFPVEIWLMNLRRWANRAGGGRTLTQFVFRW